ncbi:hypothetical protein RFI_18400, partial [Reticulomyxa filosa]
KKKKVLNNYIYICIFVIELQEHSDVTSDVILVIAANKIDSVNKNSEKDLLLSQAKAYAQEIKALYFETSARTSQGIQTLFESVAQHILSVKLKKFGCSHHDHANLNITASSAKSTCCAAATAPNKGQRKNTLSKKQQI